MFKGIFTKYLLGMSIFIVILLLIQTIVMYTVSSSVALQSKEEHVMGTTDSISTLLNRRLSENSDPDLDFEDVVAHYHSDLIWAMQLSTSEGHEMTIYVVDNEGLVLMRYGEEDELFEVDDNLPAGLVAFVKAGEPVHEVTPMKASMRVRTVWAMKPLYDAKDNQVGAVLAISNREFGVLAANTLNRSMVVSMIVTLIATIVALYAITLTVTGPLRDMSRAAKSYAKGHFDVRVPIKGNDEVAQLAASFNSMAASLDSLEKMRSSFVANVSHDMRTPMTIIGGYIESMQCGAIKPEEYDHYFTIISLEVKRLSRLVTQMLDLSRLEAGERKFTMTDFDICEMARQILISFEKKIDEKGLDVTFDTDEDSMFVNADHDAVYQILYNICDNAVKFARHGGRYAIRIFHGTQNDLPHRDGLERPESRHILVSVFDEGAGIPLEDQPFIFDRFYKSDKSRGLDKYGTGLGMYIAKTIIAAHGQEIWLNSVPDSNCEFVFSLKPADHDD